MISVLVSVLLGSVITVPIQVDGEGYLRFAKENSVVYAKHAELGWRNGLVVSQDGDPVWPKIMIDREPTALEVDLRGRVTARYSDSVIEAGRLVLAIFPDDIRPVVSGSYLKLFGESELAEPGQGLAGVVRPWSSTGEQEAEPKGEQSFVKVHLDDDEMNSKAESIIEVKKVRKTEYQADQAWLDQGGIELAFPETCEVMGSSMALGDLADIFASESVRAQLEQIDFGSAPVFGVPRQVDRNFVLSKLKLAGFNTALVRVIGPIRIKIARTGQTITQKMFEDTAVAGIADQYPDFEPETTKPTPDLEAPIGELDLRVDQVNKMGSTLNVTVVAYVDGKRINSRTLNFTNAAVPITIKVGDSVTVCVKSGAVVIETTGKVKKINSLTGEVSVQIPSGKVMIGRWTKSKKVEVSV